MRKYIKLILFVLTLFSCKTQEVIKENPPTVITKAASDVSLFNATLNGEVTDEGFTTATERGFEYSDKDILPSCACFGSASGIRSGSGKGGYSAKVDKLALNTKYYYKAYASNSKGLAYGAVQSFTTSDSKLPTAITDLPINITHSSVDLSGSVTDAGGLTITQRGICYGLNPNPTTSDNKVVSGEGLGVFKISLQNLKDNSKYYVRAYAINSRGTAYGNEQTFSTLSAPLIPRDNTTAVVEVKSPTGRIWMDRNLGASQAANSLTDEKAYGDLYQWGRAADGHQKRTSISTNNFSSTDQPPNSSFIMKDSLSSPYDWRIGQNANLWQGVNGKNNPCPVGYRLPTISELNAEYPTGVFNKTSPLKLPMAGGRGTKILGEGIYGFYWSSTTVGVYSRPLQFDGKIAEDRNNESRIIGLSVRCIKD